MDQEKSAAGTSQNQEGVVVCRTPSIGQDELMGQSACVKNPKPNP